MQLPSNPLWGPWSIPTGPTAPFGPSDGLPIGHYACPFPVSRHRPFHGSIGSFPLSFAGFLCIFRILRGFFPFFTIFFVLIFFFFSHFPLLGVADRGPLDTLGRMSVLYLLGWYLQMMSLSSYLVHLQNLDCL